MSTAQRILEILIQSLQSEEKYAADQIAIARQLPDYEPNMKHWSSVAESWASIRIRVQELAKEINRLQANTSLPAEPEKNETLSLPVATSPPFQQPLLPSYNPLPADSMTSNAAICEAVIQALRQHGGKLHSQRLYNEVGILLKPHLTKRDCEPLPSNPAIPRWRQNVALAKKTLKDKGILCNDSPKELWELTAQAMVNSHFAEPTTSQVHLSPDTKSDSADEENDSGVLDNLIMLFSTNGEPTTASSNAIHGNADGPPLLRPEHEDIDQAQVFLDSNKSARTSRACSNYAPNTSEQDQFNDDDEEEPTPDFSEFNPAEYDSIRVADLPLTVRIKNVLQRNKISTLKQLREEQLPSLSALPNLGPKSFRILQEFLKTVELKLGSYYGQEETQTGPAPKPISGHEAMPINYNLASLIRLQYSNLEPQIQLLQVENLTFFQALVLLALMKFLCTVMRTGEQLLPLSLISGEVLCLSSSAYSSKLIPPTCSFLNDELSTHIPLVGGINRNLYLSGFRKVQPSNSFVTQVTKVFYELLLPYYVASPDLALLPKEELVKAIFTTSWKDLDSKNLPFCISPSQSFIQLNKQWLKFFKENNLQLSLLFAIKLLELTRTVAEQRQIDTTSALFAPFPNLIRAVRLNNIPDPNAGLELWRLADGIEF